MPSNNGNLALMLDNAQQERSDKIVQFCEANGLNLRLTFAVMAIVDGHRTNQPGRILEAQHWIGQHLQNRATETPEGKIDPVRHRAVETLTEAKKKLKALEKPVKQAKAVKAKTEKPERTRKVFNFQREKAETAGKGKKFCSQCGEARGVRAFLGGSTICTTCVSGAKPEPPRPRAKSLADAETM